jgi:alanine dehydrogenase
LAEAANAARNMIKTHVEWGRSTLHVIGAVFPERGFCGTKTWTHTADGAMRLLILFDSRTGSINAIIEAFALGQLRTAAASRAATKWLASEHADTLGMIGTGNQALSQVAAVFAVRPLKRVQVFGRNEDRRTDFVQLLESTFEINAVGHATVQDALQDASITTVATRATEPLIDAKMVQPVRTSTRSELSFPVGLRSRKM